MEEAFDLIDASPRSYVLTPTAAVHYHCQNTCRHNEEEEDIEKSGVVVVVLGRRVSTVGFKECGYGAIPRVEEMMAGYHSPGAALSLKALVLLTKPLRTTSALTWLSDRVPEAAIQLDARLNANPSRPALPSIFLSNVCSLDNKLDYIRLQQTTRREFRDCCVFVFTETWLSDRVPDAAIQLDALTVFRADRNTALCGKTRGGGVCVYINTEWCKSSVLVSCYCSSLVEFVTVRCRPFYLPREFTTVYIVGVYIPPSANAKEALSELYGAISDLQNAHPDGLFIIAGDFNHANLKTVLPKLHQHVDFATRGANTLDLVYTNIPGAYRAEPRPHLGYSDHCSVMLIPAYRPLIRRSKPVLKQVKTWPEGATSALQDCFECTDWDMFREAATYGDSINLEEYTSSVTCYISKCVDDVTISKSITTRSNQKPWMTANVRALLKQRDSAFRTGDKAALKTARAKLSRAIREAKRAHAKKIHDHFQDSGDTRRMWQGIQVITNYKTTSPACDRDASLPDALNDFYARFEVQNNVVVRKTIPPPTDQVLCLTTAEVRKTLCRVNPRKSAGPDNIPGRVLRECAEQLADVFTDIFNISLSSNVVPTCLKTTTIVPVPKKSTVSCLNDYRPVALTPIVMKCFERLVMRHIKTQLPPSLDPMQFAYRPNRSTDDAISTTLHLALTHLDNKDSYVRMLFIDFSSAFNTIIPQHLIEKLNLLGLNTSLCNWILDFLTGRPQAVRIGNSISSTTTLSTGAPQGCVLSPLLFTLLTHDCAPRHSSNHIIKFADDTTVVGLISKNDEEEMVVDFRRAQSDQSPLIIDGSSVEIVHQILPWCSSGLTWSLNTSSITKKAQQRLYFLRRLRKAHLPPPILSMFYRGTIESILSSCITAWFGNCTVSDRPTLQRIVRTAEKIIGVSLPSIMDIYTTRSQSTAHSIVDDHTHPSHTYFTLLPSGKRFRSIRAVTTRLCNSFFPQAIRLLNTKN
ncbi:gastrula zinc finger protein XlCGF28.1-like [Silurus meridionalis]|nr:gastrula zinc finger protein XlCGF28.1-like [Silurus meridionalis]